MSPDALAEAVEAALHACHKLRGCKVYALIDGSLRPEASKALAGLPCKYALPARLRAEPKQYWALPWVAELPLESTVRLRWYLRCTATWALESDAATWMASPLGVDDLAVVLGARMDMVLEGDMHAVLRIADARVLPVVHRVLRPDQADAFFGLVDAWWYLDRRGELRQLELRHRDSTSASTAATSVTPTNVAWTFDDEQHAQLIEAAEPDAVLALLHEHDREAFEALARFDRFDFVRRSIEVARRWNIEATLDRAMYCALVLRLGEDFHDKPPWQAALADVRARRVTLDETVAKHLGATSG